MSKSYDEIRMLPRIIHKEEINCGPDNCIHDRFFRSNGCLEKVIELLKQGTPPKVILEIIEHIMKG